MLITEINKRPTVLDNNHESLYRSYHILEKVKWLLENNVASTVILELISDMEYED